MAGLPVPGPGRKSAYRPEFADQARKLCLLGFTDEELAKFFGVDVRTINRWKADKPAFCHALHEGKEWADANVADSLYRRATGEEIIIEKAVKTEDGKYEVMRLKQFVPGDVGAQKLWLINRRRQNWRDKQDVEHSGYIDGASKEQRDAAVAAATRADQ